MAKKKDLKVENVMAEVIDTKAEVNKIAGMDCRLVMPNTEALGELRTMEPVFSMTTRYKKATDWELIRDKPLRCFFMGLKEVPNDDGESVMCGVFVSEKEVFLSGQTILIEAVKELEMETPLQITYRGSKKNKSSKGDTMLFDIEKLGRK